jgi:hypothetical protein
MSINYSCREYWTDGRAVNSLAPQHGGLLKCKCGSYFSYRHAEPGPIIYDPLPPPPKGWESEDVWEGFLQGGQSKRDYLLAKYDFRPESERDKERLAKPPAEITVQDAELLDLLKSDCSNTDVLIVARRRYWRYLNDEYRTKCRKYIKFHDGEYPPYVPTEAQMENMHCLLGLSNSQVDPDYLEIAELHRELGDFKIAFDVIATKYQENERQKEVGDVIANLIYYKQNQPRIAKMYV